MHNVIPAFIILYKPLLFACVVLTYSCVASKKHLYVNWCLTTVHSIRAVEDGLTCNFNPILP